MPRRTARPKPTREFELPATTRTCPACGGPLWAAYKSHRTVATLDGLVRLAIQVRRCRNADCPRRGVPLRSEREGGLALPQHEFGLDVIALIGALRHAEHRSVPEIHAELTRRGVAICLRSVGSLLDRYDELLALALTDPARIRSLTAAAGRVILAIDGLQPDVGHEVLWVIRDVLSGEVLLARSLLSSCRDDLAKLLGEVKQALRAEGAPEVPIAGVVSDGQHSIRKAVAEVLPGVPHQLCQFHYLREAARPIYEADRHAKVRLKKEARGIRPIERTIEGREGDQADVIRGYCAAVRGALTDDGRPPLEASGLRLRDRLARVAESLDRAGAKGGCRRS
jgi:Transposase, Mutator family